MNKLIYLEWLKFSKHKGIRNGLLVYILLMLGGFFAAKEFVKISANPLVDTASLITFPQIWDLNAYLGNWLAFFIMGFVGIQIVSIEFSNKTFRQNVIAGLERKEFWASKMMSALILSAAATFFYVIMTLALGFIYSSDTETVWGESGMMPIIYFFFMTLGHMLLGMTIAFAIRKGSIALFSYFLYGMFIENIIRWVAHNKILPNSKSMHYYPINVLEDMTPAPYFGQVSKMGSNEMEMMLSSNEALMGAIVFTVCYFLITFYLATQKDI